MTRTYYMREGDKPDRAPPFSLRLTKDERRKLEERAGTMPLASYIKSLIFAEDAPTYRKRRKGPVKDHQSLADVLAALGRSHLATNLSQLAKAANIGDLYFDDETKRLIARACDDIKAMRQMLMTALGLKITEPPANESVAQTFARKAAPAPAADPAPSPSKRYGL
ncbi:hypothetical protein [Novosphingobium aquimarinum]|uniref:hypothetical protein n=1 Tax=Novosphingobium aquimarinum TaxID=2682494 RepID=UPI0018DC904F|nr:hypothetical protein [Novosphingobium aquimarinum]